MLILKYLFLFASFWTSKGPWTIYLRAHLSFKQKNTKSPWNQYTWIKAKKKKKLQIFSEVSSTAHSCHTLAIMSFWWHTCWADGPRFCNGHHVTPLRGPSLWKGLRTDSPFRVKVILENILSERDRGEKDKLMMWKEPQPERRRRGF